MNCYYSNYFLHLRTNYQTRFLGKLVMRLYPLEPVATCYAKTCICPPPHSLTKPAPTEAAPSTKPAHPDPTPPDAPPGWERLKPREQLVLRLIAKRLTTKEIADRFCLSESAVIDIRRHLSAKLGQEGCHNLLRFALHHHSFLCGT